MKKKTQKSFLPFKKVRKLYKTGRKSSYGITLPKEVIETFGWREKQKVVIEINFKKKRLLIRDWKKKDR